MPKFRCRDITSKQKQDIVSVATTLAGVPAILRIPATVTRPPIVLWHGFGPPASERALLEALPLDEIAAVKVYVGLPLFGDRAPEGGMREVARRQAEDLASEIYEPVILGAAHELERILEALTHHTCLGAHEQVGLFGFSAGGAAVLSALMKQTPSVTAAITLNASTGLHASITAYERATHHQYTWTPRARQLAKETDAVARASDIAGKSPRPPALLILHGNDDTMLPPKTVQELYHALRPFYQRENTGRLQLSLLSGVAHAWTTPETLHKLRKQIAEWYQRFL